LPSVYLLTLLQNDTSTFKPWLTQDPIWSSLQWKCTQDPIWARSWNWLQAS
jgi:hypothetical protein